MSPHKFVKALVHFSSFSPRIGHPQDTLLAKSLWGSMRKSYDGKHSREHNFCNWRLFCTSSEFVPYKSPLKKKKYLIEEHNLILLCNTHKLSRRQSDEKMSCSLLQVALQIVIDKIQQLISKSNIIEHCVTSIDRLHKWHWIWITILYKTLGFLMLMFPDKGFQPLINARLRYSKVLLFKFGAIYAISLREKEKILSPWWEWPSAHRLDDHSDHWATGD